jgi:hypothetical protein
MAQGHGSHYRDHVIWSAVIGCLVAATGVSLEEWFSDFFREIGVHEFFVQIWPTGWSPHLLPAALGASIVVVGLLLANRRNSQRHDERALPVPHQNVTANPQQHVTVNVGSPWTPTVASTASTEERPRPIHRNLEALEQAICKKVEAEIQIAIREAKTAAKSQEHVTAINANIKREYLQRGSVFHKSIDIEIEHYLLPLLTKIIAIETKLRIDQGLTFSDRRTEWLRGRLREIVMDNWSSLVRTAHRDSINHVIEFEGRVPNYIDKELEAIRVQTERQAPDGLLLA